MGYMLNSLKMQAREEGTLAQMQRQFAQWEQELEQAKMQDQQELERFRQNMNGWQDVASNPRMMRSVEQQAKNAPNSQYDAAWAKEMMQAYQNLVNGRPVWTGLEKWGGQQAQQPQPPAQPQQVQQPKSAEDIWNRQLDREGNTKNIAADVERREELGDTEAQQRYHNWLTQRRQMGYNV